MKELKLAEVGAWLRKRQQIAKTISVTGLVVVLSAWTSCSARKISKAAAVNIEEAVAIRETATRFAQQFLPATSAETDEWSRTTEEAAEFGSPEDARLSLAQSVSRIAEIAGMSGVKASFALPDTSGIAEVRKLGELTFQPASYGLSLEGTGSVLEMARVVIRLPPATEITSLSLAGDVENLKATFQLAVYQSAGGAQN